MSVPTLTTNLKLVQPYATQRNWDLLLNALIAALDGLGALGPLAVTAHDVDLTTFAATTLKIDVAAGTYIDNNGQYQSYAGTGGSPVTLASSSTKYVWLTAGGTLTNGSAWPSAGTRHVRLAVVVTGSSAITSITDARAPWAAGGSSGEQLTDSTGGTPSTTLAAATNINALTDSTGGSASTTLASISDTATKNAIASLAHELATQRALNTVLINAVASLAAQINQRN